MDLSKVMAVGKNRKKVRVGRGSGSGLGKTSGAATTARSAHRLRRAAPPRGGQMPLIRRIPKRGFRNTMFREAFDVVNLDKLVLSPARRSRPSSSPARV